MYFLVLWLQRNNQRASQYATREKQVQLKALAVAVREEVFQVILQNGVIFVWQLIVWTHSLSS